MRSAPARPPVIMGFHSMSGPGPDPVRLEDLHRRFETAAYDAPTLRAVVVYRPARPSGRTEYTPDTSEPFFEGFVRGRVLAPGISVYTATPPPFRPRVSVPDRNQPDFEGIIRAAWAADPRCESARWNPFLYFNSTLENERYAMLGVDAARLLRCDSGRGGTPPGDWLVYLAERVGVHAHNATRFLIESLIGPSVANFPPQDFHIRRSSKEPGAAPLPFTPSWWVVEFRNIFLLSRNVVASELKRVQAALSRPGGTTFGSHAGPPAAGTPVLPPTQVRPSRVSCDENDRSIYLDGRRIAEGLEPHLFGFVQQLALAYPDRITFRRINNQVKGLRGKHPTRDVIRRLPPQVQRLIEGSVAGYALRLPPAK